MRAVSLALVLVSCAPPSPGGGGADDDTADDDVGSVDATLEATSDPVDVACEKVFSVVNAAGTYRTDYWAADLALEERPRAIETVRCDNLGPGYACPAGSTCTGTYPFGLGCEFGAGGQWNDGKVTVYCGFTTTDSTAGGSPVVTENRWNKVTIRIVE